MCVLGEGPGVWCLGVSPGIWGRAGMSSRCLPIWGGTRVSEWVSGCLGVVGVPGECLREPAFLSLDPSLHSLPPEQRSGSPTPQ